MEAKYKKLAKPIDTRILQNFMKRENNAKKATVVNLNFNYEDGSVGYADYRFINI